MRVLVLAGILNFVVRIENLVTFNTGVIGYIDRTGHRRHNGNLIAMAARFVFYGPEMARRHGSGVGRRALVALLVDILLVQLVAQRLDMIGGGLRRDGCVVITHGIVLCYNL